MEGDYNKYPVMRGEGAISAMQSEMYKYDTSRNYRVQQRREDADEKPRGCWATTKRVFKYIWFSRETAENEYELAKAVLRELVVYAIFLIVLGFASLGTRNMDMFHFTHTMKSMLITNTDGGNFKKTYDGITRMDDFWDYINGPLLNTLYWANRTSIQQDDKNNYTVDAIFYENKVLGVPQLRQLRVKKDSCLPVPDAFEREIKECYAAYNDYTGVEATESFGKWYEDPFQDTPLFHYTTPEDSNSTSYWGQVATYGKGGYIWLWNKTRTDTENYMNAYMKAGRWIDRGTRAVFIDLTLYNANLNLFCIVKLLMEFPASGGILPSYSFKTMNLIRYTTTYDKFILVMELTFCFFIVFYIVEEIIEVYKHRCSYFKKFWNILDIIVLFLGICAIAFSVYRYLEIKKKLGDGVDDPESILFDQEIYISLESLGNTESRYQDLIALLVFTCWIKIFKYLSFHKTMSQLNLTLGRCAKDIGGFAIMFFIFFFAYAQLGYLLFGTQVRDFSSFYNAVFTLLRVILGDFEFHELEQANRVLGPIFFITYVFFVFFVLLNMFLAIINDTYADVKSELHLRKNEFEIGEFFKKGYYKLIRKLKSRKTRLKQMQNALKFSKKSGSDKEIDYDEWKQQMRSRGFNDEEIDAVFVKYDADHDLSLDHDEQLRLQEELEKEQEAIEHVKEELEAERAAEKIQGGVSEEEFNRTYKRVDKVEQTMGSVILKIDLAFGRLEALDKEKQRHRDKCNKIIDSSKKKQRPNWARLADEAEEQAAERASSQASATSGGTRN